MKCEIDDCYAKWLMVCLADHANEESHQCWPSLDLLAKRTKMNRVTVTRKLNWLEKEGWIIRKRGTNNRSTLYTIFPDVVAQCNSVVAESNTNLSYKPKQISVEKQVRLSVPNDWQPNDDLIASIKKRGHIDHDHETDQFRNFHNAKGSTFKDIGRAYQYWCNNRIKWDTDKQSDTKTTGSKQSTSRYKKPSIFGGIYTRITD